MTTDSIRTTKLFQLILVSRKHSWELQVLKMYAVFSFVVIVSLFQLAVALLPGYANRATYDETCGYKVYITTNVNIIQP